MKDIKKKYIQILKIEMEDLHNDIEMYMQEMQTEANSGTITNYVFMENLALLKNETVGIDIVNGYLDSINLDEFSDISELIDKIKTDLKQKLENDGIVHALYIYLERKLDKVRTYVSQTS